MDMWKSPDYQPQENAARNSQMWIDRGTSEWMPSLPLPHTHNPPGT